MLQHNIDKNKDETFVIVLVRSVTVVVMLKYLTTKIQLNWTYL